MTFALKLTVWGLMSLLHMWFWGHYGHGAVFFCIWLAYTCYYWSKDHKESHERAN